jgi:hypothetical protein
MMVVHDQQTKWKRLPNTLKSLLSAHGSNLINDSELEREWDRYCPKISEARYQLWRLTLLRGRSPRHAVHREPRVLARIFTASISHACRLLVRHSIVGEIPFRQFCAKLDARKSNLRIESLLRPSRGREFADGWRRSRFTGRSSN